MRDVTRVSQIKRKARSPSWQWLAGCAAGLWLGAVAHAQISHTPIPLDDPTSTEGAFFGNDVAGVGDMNGDGVPDLLVGAPIEETFGESQGQAFVFSGVDRRLLRTLDNPTPQRDRTFFRRACCAANRC